MIESASPRNKRRPWPRERQARVSLIAAIAIMVVWGCNFAITKYALSVIGVAPFLFVRYATMPVLALALLLLVFHRRLRRAIPAKEDLPRLAACGLIGHTLHVGIVTYGIHLSTAFSSALVLTSGPVFTLLILAWLGTDKLHGRQIAGTAIAFAGIVLFLSDKFTRGLAQAGAGDLVLVFAASLFSLYTVIARPLTERYGPIMLTAYALLFGAPPLLIVTLPAMIALDIPSVPGMVWIAVFWAVVVSAFLGWLVWAWVNAVRGVARSAPLQYLMPPIAGLVAWFSLDEAFTWLKVLGAGITMSGVAWAQFGGRRPPPREAAQADSG